MAGHDAEHEIDAVTGRVAAPAARETEHGATPLRRAAVLVPVFRKGRDELRIVLVRRSERGIHGGQLAFPGGNCEPEDGSLLETALREAREETGLDPARAEVLEPLPIVETMTSRYRIAPFLARVVPPEAWRPQESEIAEIMDVDVNALAAPGVRDEALMHFPTWPEPRKTPFFQVGAHRLWGATFRILEPLVPRLLAGEWRL